MVGSSKILTVSYGTFSCTLEGFDDSFDTMKAIAEYFRDLAADDRYFGAEPPTPDADMLARIAEREIDRRVTARMENSGIVLRASSLSDQRDIADDKGQAEPAPADVPAAPPTPVAKSDDGAAKVATPEVEPAQQDAPAPDAKPEPAVASEPDWAMPPAAPMTAPAAAPAVIAAAAAMPKAAPVAAPVAKTPTQVAAPAHPDPDSVAAKLQRIRAVVGRGAASAATTAAFAPDFTEDLAEPDTTGSDTLDEAMSNAEIEVSADTSEFDDMDFDTIDEDLSDAPDTATERVEASSDDEDDTETSDAKDDALLSALSSLNIDAEKQADDTVADTDENDDDDDDTVSAEDIDFDIFGGSDDDDDLDDTMEDDLLDLDAEEVDDDEPVAATSTPVTEEKVEAIAPANPLRARVIRMKKVDFEQAISAGSIESVEEDEDEPATAALDDLDGLEEYADLEASSDAALDPNDEADLMEELAGLERDTGSDLLRADDQDEDDVDENEDEDEAAIDMPAPQDDEPAAPRRASRLAAEPDDEAAMSRIMSETDAKMQEPEGSRRRDAIAHLKAAVAATEAARQLGDEGKADTSAETAFRDDLSQVVRPRRAPSVDPTEERRTERPRPAPLKLVASQRVDIPAGGTTTTPVQPRRVAVTEAPVSTKADTSGSFADFAEDMGVSGLAELLEAAAVYTSMIEGAEEFSRPQIMKKVRDLSPEEFSREDGLRTFGTLLRQGRIEKISNGRFQITEQTRFRPEPRAAQR